ncbi:DUF1905 domain-containing protein [Candidatus Peregrinibacteria bacterium]|nr:DUF1905 domain-containing protein [Candidatus Peregrinibacteria bacterium]
MEPTFTFKSKMWLWQGKGAWHFITVPLNLSKKIKGFHEGPRKGFGSIPVAVRIGKTTWKTSIFPTKEGTYVLPIKKDIRKKENLELNKNIEVNITLQ